MLGQLDLGVDRVWMEAWAFWWPGGLEMCPGEQGEVTSQFCLMWHFLG